MRKMEGFQKGVNLGGWISQFDQYDKEHFDTFITEKDICSIASLGFDHVRVPVDYILLEEEDGTPKADGFDYLDRCRRWCARYGLRMLIDLHECYGYSFDPLKKDMDREKFFHDRDLQERFLKLWSRIAAHFQEYQDQIAFEPLNEIVPADAAGSWNAIAAAYIRMMRTIVPDSYLVIGGVKYSNVLSVPLLELPLASKIVYNFHCYEPILFTHQGAYWVDCMPSGFRIGYPKPIEEYQSTGKELGLSEEHSGAVYSCKVREMGEAFFEELFLPAIKKAQADDVPLYCGEYGVIDLADNPDKLRWLRDIHTVMNRHGIGRALWNYKEKDFGFVNVSFSEIREAFVRIL